MLSPASAYGAGFDYLVWNRAYVLVRDDPLALPPERRNLLWMMFTENANRVRMAHWSVRRGRWSVKCAMPWAVGPTIPDWPRWCRNCPL
ncbi:hypothetical protein GLP40_09030 [Nocardia sp. CT2-14]|uniref:MmyB-like transcription regulator ligand binding domain-containing protein n=1 Tax=Nocardia aurantiaca TaxID=2675850 RepID=A0A6I3KV52_9NOCA|nr:hypothetical protein [Nocardia aurantiaca]